VSGKDSIVMGGPIYVIDDDDWVCDSGTVLLETYGYEVLAYGSGEQFLRADGRGNAECLVIDQHMPGIDGLGVVAELRREGIAPPTILITGATRCHDHPAGRPARYPCGPGEAVLDRAAPRADPQRSRTPLISLSCRVTGLSKRSPSV
jgi:CheY-like chemotaxis protein